MVPVRFHKDAFIHVRAWENDVNRVVWRKNPTVQKGSYLVENSRQNWNAIKDVASIDMLCNHPENRF